MDLAVLRTSTRVVERVDGEDLTAVFGFGLMVTDPGKEPTEVLFAKLAWIQGTPKYQATKSTSSLSVKARLSKALDIVSHACAPPYLFS